MSRMVNVRHPRRNVTSSCVRRPDGLWEFPDGTAVREDEIRGIDAPGVGSLADMLIVLVFALACVLGALDLLP